MLKRAILLSLLLSLPVLGDKEMRYTVELVDTTSAGILVKVSDGYFLTLVCYAKPVDEYGLPNPFRCDDVKLMPGIVYSARSGPPRRPGFQIFITETDDQGKPG